VTERESLGSSRLIEIIIVLVLGITTLGTAWCSYEAYQWNSQQSSLAQQTTSAELNANRLFGLATQKVTYDSSLLADYATAYRANDTKLMQFYRQSLMRPQLLPYLDAWVADVQAGKAPQNLLSDPAYLDPVMADYTAAAAKVATLDAQSKAAGSYADRYLVTTILLAVGLFFGGVTSSFRWTPAKLAIIAFAVIAIGIAASRLVDLPVQL
jgi:hypothetical protein